MDLAKLTMDEIKSFDDTRLRDVEVDIRKSIMKIRLDAFKEKGKNSGVLRGLKKRLARALTIRQERSNQQNKN